jgi:hypothetical protein
VSGPTLELLPLLQRMAVLPMLKFGTVDPVVLHTAVSTTFRGFNLALFGRYRLYMHAPEEEGGRATFDEAGFRASLAGSPAAAAFFETTFIESQLFDVFIEDRKQECEEGFPHKGVFEREVAELMGNIEMFGEERAEGPWSSIALEYAQHFRVAFGFAGAVPRTGSAGGAVVDDSYLGGVMRSPAKLLSGLSKRIW